MLNTCLINKLIKLISGVFNIRESHMLLFWHVIFEWKKLTSCFKSGPSHSLKYFSILFTTIGFYTFGY